MWETGCAGTGWVDGGSNGQTVFAHTKAALRDPHFGMRFMWAKPPRGTLASVSDPLAPDADARGERTALSHLDLLWDVSFGERLPMLAYFADRSRPHLWRPGLQLNLDAAAFLLLDFEAQSSATINTDYLLGLSADYRPWNAGPLEYLSASVAVHHVSSHLGDEYALGARTIQAGREPAVNSRLPYRANPSYQAIPFTLSVDVPFDGRFDLAGRVYGGGRMFFDSSIGAAARTEWRAGAEFRWDPDSYKDDEGTVRRGRWWSVDASYELLVQRAYALDGVEDRARPAPARFHGLSSSWLTQQLRFALRWNLSRAVSSSRSVDLAFRYTDGRNQHGQLIEYDHIRQAALDLSYYW